MASLFKHPKSRFWSACYTNRDGKQVKRSTKCTNRSKALKIALSFEDLERNAKEGVATTVQIQRVASNLAQDINGESLATPTVAEFLNDWLVAKRRTSSAGTIERYGHTVSHFLKHLGKSASMRIGGLAPRHIESFLAARLKEGVAASTANVDVKTLGVAFNRAERLGVILKNPVRVVELPAGKSSERDVFTHEQLQALLVAAPSEDWRTLIYLGYYTGARLSDCAAFTWESVDSSQRVIRYTQQKTGKEVVVPLHVELFERLCFLNEFSSEGPLCGALSKKGPGGKLGLSESFKRIVKKAGIDQGIVQGQGTRKFTKLTFHSLRHSFNSNLANAGVSPEIRCKLTGHSSFSMNDRYTRFKIPPLQTAIQTLPSLEGPDEDVAPAKARPAQRPPKPTAPTAPPAKAISPDWEI